MNIQSQTISRERNAFWVAIIGCIGSALPGIFYLYLAFQNPSWQLFGLSGFTLLLTVAALACMILIRRGRVELGIWIMIGTAQVSFISSSALLGGLGITLGVAIAVLSIIMASIALPSKQMGSAIITGVVAASVCILLDALALDYRLPAPGIVKTSHIIVTGAIAVIYIYFLAPFKNLNLRNKVIAAFLLVSVTSVGIQTFITDSVIRSDLTQNVGTGLKRTSASLGQTIGDQLTAQVSSLSVLGLSNNVTDKVQLANTSYAGDLTTIQAEIDRLDKQWLAAVAANNDADPLVQSRLNNLLSGQLRDFRASAPDHVEIFVTDIYGALISTSNKTSDYNQGDEAWWQSAYNNGQGAIYIGTPELDASSGMISIIMAIPLYDKTPKLIGILRSTYNISAIEKSLGLTQSGQTGKNYLLLPNNQVMESNGSFVAFAPDVMANTQSAASVDYVQFAYEGKERLLSLSPVISADSKYGTSINNLAWKVITNQETSEALQPVANSTRSGLLTGFAVLVVASFVAVLIGQSLTSPIVRLTGVAEKVRAGDLTIQAPVESNDEIGKLAETFNAMTAQIRELIGSLEQRVVERTRNLELAGEVGRTVSQVRSLDIMLKDAAELIRKQFDLYYVQVYLADSSQTNLILQSGTGTVGAELIERGHRLPLDTASINGRAAAEKRSVIISNTAKSPAFKPNPLLPDTRSEMAVPLLIGNRVVGVLDMQSEHADALNQDVLSAFEAMAGQLAIAVQNANFLAETERARAEVEAQARRLSRANWVDYMDAIHKPEEIGFVFEKNQIAPMTQAEQSQPQMSVTAISAPIAVTGEALGNLVVEMEGGSPIARTNELINTVAQQVARQIESLRLLESAERYRFEAEEAARRVTREGWQDYMDANTAKGLGFIYDLKEVRPYNQNEDQQIEESDFSLPLKVHDETVGKLSVLGLKSDDKESLDLVNAVAERLGAHIEGLRLSKQTEEALASTQRLAQREQALRQITSAVRGSTDPATILRSAVRELGTLLGRKTIVRLATAEQARQTDSPADLVGDSAATSGNEPLPPAESQNAVGGDQ